ncbi:FAD-binding oxidoreductase [Paracoccus benzoatiresistens]|uniref:FAD-binding oxidoreductase n=1 Tax=Paracoccus benzoatiresistens TaxID=2997341 RepID=A0ABT4JAX3_9RHOB|nr:FAD-binding oxidoreductase [Paracoccus sp. EF6]MCZ0963747.1 FAD-binding oxidoreductase [Paracoccus sp. EF6]
MPGLLGRSRGIIARGNGRAYGDAAIGERLTLGALGLDRMKAFDPQTGRLTVEAGVLLADILAAFVPRGFFPPVVPGTKLVTVGGMIAADVHGKNHHREGSFGDHVERLTLVQPSGEAVVCGPHDNPDLFRATVGGMGLTGVITEATFRMKPIETGWIRQRTVVAGDLAGALKALDESDAATYSVAWIDCLSRGADLGRSLVFVGEHATRQEVASDLPRADILPQSRAGRLGVPIDLPGWTLNKASVAAFNEVYFRQGAKKSGTSFLAHWDPYFFPLDGVHRWNRIYGRRGFFQHQCVVPPFTAHAALSEILDRITRSGKASFLAVLKKMGAGGSLMSFPMPGYTLALDLRVTDETFALLDDIDRIVVAAGGRLYLAKDARQSRQTFEAGYPALGRFNDIRGAIGATGHLASHLSSRLGI